MSFCIRSEGASYIVSSTGSDTSLELSRTAHSDSLVNVASVPLRSPFRYPGGKTWLVPRVRRWLASLPKRPNLLVEPFAGGGIVGLTAAFESLVDRVLLVELDADVAAVWETILAGDADHSEWLASRILKFDLTDDRLRETLARKPRNARERAFQTILRNRTHRGGILAPGASRLRRGENDRGLLSRWYPETLAKRIREIAAIRDRVEFVRGDGIEAILARARLAGAAFFVDPPYTAGGSSGKGAGAGSRLYAHHELDHERLFEVAARARGPVLLTYDDAPEARALAARHGFRVRAVPMKTAHHARTRELLIARDLDWLEERGVE